MKTALLTAVLALMAMTVKVNAQNSFPIAAKNFRVIAYKQGSPSINSVSNYAMLSPKTVLYVPNAFTPNGDGINEVFMPKGENLRNFNMRIFNRWGEMVFETNDVSKGWDGTYKGVLSQQDVYTYKISARGEVAALIEQEGTVTLLD